MMAVIYSNMQSCRARAQVACASVANASPLTRFALAALCVVVPSACVLAQKLYVRARKEQAAPIDAFTQIFGAILREDYREDLDEAKAKSVQAAIDCAVILALTRLQSRGSSAEESKKQSGDDGAAAPQEAGLTKEGRAVLEGLAVLCLANPTFVRELLLTRWPSLTGAQDTETQTVQASEKLDKNFLWVLQAQLIAEVKQAEKGSTHALKDSDQAIVSAAAGTPQKTTQALEMDRALLALLGPPLENQEGYNSLGLPDATTARLTLLSSHSHLGECAAALADMCTSLKKTFHGQAGDEGVSVAGYNFSHTNQEIGAWLGALSHSLTKGEIGRLPALTQLREELEHQQERWTLERMFTLFFKDIGALWSGTREGT